MEVIKQSSVTPSSAHLESTTMQEIDGPFDQILAAAFIAWLSLLIGAGKLLCQTSTKTSAKSFVMQNVKQTDAV